MYEDKLRQAAIDVAYELKMFREARNRYIKPVLLTASGAQLGHNDSRAGMPLTMSASAGAPSPQYADYLDRDALLIHIRILSDFFYKPSHDDDIRAHDYIGGGPRQPPAWARDFSKKCNKLFAHLTYRRTEYRARDEHHWHEVPGWVNDIDAEMTHFLESLIVEQRKWFQVVGI